MAFIQTTLSLKGRALRLLSGREYSRAELEKKLQAFEATTGELAKVLDELQAKDFINEQRVVDSVLHRRSNKLGTARIKQELQSKGVDAGAVLDAVDLLKSTELERAREVWRKKFGNRHTPDSPPQTPTERAKQMRFLLSRGFGAEVIHKVVAGGGDFE
ncbi:MAG TPA: recombination regulator RecX [Burkholderiaceae bacterium]|nr:recombination regulator RecX [Burkholderiaceae bacterium]